MLKSVVKDRLRWANDQCPLPGSAIPSLHHTRWYGESHNEVPAPIFHADGFTSVVFKSRFFSWYRTFSISEPPLPPSLSLVTVLEWLPRYEPVGQSGWMPFGRHYTSAYARLHANYLNDWRQHARRHLKYFKRSGCQLRLGTRADIVNLYAHSQVPKSLQSALLWKLDQHLTAHSQTIDILVAEKHGQPVACHVVGNCAEAKLSEYLIGAFHPQATQDSPMVGLIDWWYRRSLERGFTTLTFGFMEPWAGSLPKTGYGYSYFKTHFGVERIWFPKNRWKIIFNHKGLFSKNFS